MKVGGISLGFWGFDVSDGAAWRRLLADLPGPSGAGRDADGAAVCHASGLVGSGSIFKTQYALTGIERCR